MSHFHSSIARMLVLSLAGGLCICHADSGHRRESNVDSLISRLSGASFQDRLDAEEECIRHGDEALPALQEAVRSQDPELRLRASQLIQRIEQKGLGRSVQLFLAPNSTTELPGWAVVGEIIEDSPANRTFYAQLLMAEPLLAQALRKPDQLGRELTRRQQEFGHSFFNGGGGNIQSPNRLAAMLILLLHPQLDVPDLVRNETSRVIAFGLNSVQGDTPPEKFVQALAIQWVATPRPNTAQFRFDLGSRMTCAEVLIPAMELLRTKPVSASATNLFLMVTRYGGPEEMSQLQELLSDTAVQWTHERQDDTKVQTQVRDLALSALIEMTKQKPEDYGLKAFDRDANGRVRYLRPMFETEAAREAALEKWKVWSAQNLKRYWIFPRSASEGTTL